MTKLNNIEVSYSELTHAYHCCRKRKRRTENALQFEINDAERLYDLYLTLNNKTYEIGQSIAFCVDKPTKREIFAADFRDRIVHHLVINRTNKYFEGEFIDDSYSCRKGRGTSYAIRRCAEQIDEASEGYSKKVYIVKCDLKSFFMRIDRNILYNKLCAFLIDKGNREGEDMDYTLWLIEKIIFNEPQEGCIRKRSEKCWEGLPKEKSLFNAEKGKGLPIGNLPSQIFANFYLNDFDKFVKSIGVKWYGRYVDDFFFIVRDKHEMREAMAKMGEKLAEVGVQLNPQKLYIQEVRKGVKFVGAVIKPHRVYVNNRVKGNFSECLKRYAHRFKSEPTREEIEGFVASVNSYLGTLKHYATYNIRKRMLESELMERWQGYCSVNDDYSKLKIAA